MGLKPGDVVVMSLEDGVLRIESHLARIRRIQEEFKKFATPGTSRFPTSLSPTAAKRPAARWRSRLDSLAVFDASAILAVVFRRTGR